MRIFDLTISEDKESRTDAQKHRFFYGEMKEPRELTAQELHNLAMNIVGRQLEAEGFEFMAVNSKPKKNPQFVCLKDKILHFIVVRYVILPENPKDYDRALLEKMKNHATKFEAKTYYAGVGFSNAKDQNLPVYLNEDYIVDYQGLIEI